MSLLEALQASRRSETFNLGSVSGPHFLETLSSIFVETICRLLCVSVSEAESSTCHQSYRVLEMSGSGGSGTSGTSPIDSLKQSRDNGIELLAPPRMFKHLIEG